MGTTAKVTRLPRTTGTREGTGSRGGSWDTGSRNAVSCYAGIYAPGLSSGVACSQRCVYCRFLSSYARHVSPGDPGNAGMGADLAGAAAGVVCQLAVLGVLGKQPGHGQRKVLLSCGQMHSCRKVLRVAAVPSAPSHDLLPGANTHSSSQAA